MNDTVNAPDGSLLCKACGLCCDGNLHDYALLTDEDDERQLASMGLATSRIFDGKQGIKLPCRCFDQICSIYDQDSPYPYQGRANVCASFMCKLLKQYMTGQTPEKQALYIIQKTVHHTMRVRKNLLSISGRTEEKNISLISLYEQARKYQEDSEKSKNAHIFVDYIALQVRLDKYFRFK